MSATSSEIDDFDAAFDEALTGDAPEPEPEKEETPSEPEPEKEPEPEPEPVKDETPPEPEPDYRAMYEEEVRVRKTADGRTSALQRQLNELMAAQQAPAPAPETPKEPSEEDQFLTKFQEEYHPDVVKAIEIVSQRKAQALAQSLLQQQLQPVASSVQEMMNRAHFQAIEAVHPDWEQVSAAPEFKEWIETRPSHLRRAYDYVVERGSPREVVDLLTEFKDSTKPKPATAARPQTHATPQQVRSATAVPVPRGGLPRSTQEAMDDFDAAWEEALASDR